MNIKQMMAYSIKVWLTALLIAPALIIGIQTLQHNYGLTSWFAYGMALAVGAFYSVPSAALLCLAIDIVSRYCRNYIAVKIWLTFAGILLTLLASSICFRRLPHDNDEVFFTEVYTAVIVAGVWFYKLKMKEQKIAIVKESDSIV